MALILLMSLSLPGIVTVQYIWVKNALQVRKEEFKNRVIESLQKSTERIENFRYIEFFHSNNVPPPPPPPPPPEIIVPEKNIKNRVVTNFSSENEKEKKYSFTQTVEDDESRKTTADTVVPAQRHEISIKINQLDTVIVVKAPKITTSKFNNVIIEGFKKKEEKIQWFSDKLYSEMLLKEDDKPVPIDTIKTIIDDEFNKNNIVLPYELSIIDSGKITQSVAVVSDTLNYLKSSYKVILYPNNIFNKKQFLAVRFTGEYSYLVKSLLWLLVASLVFTMLITGSFILSIIFITRQKKVSQVKSDFINNMTHEFKTPIATIGVAVDTLINPKIISDAEKVTEYAELIRQENRRMHGHVEKILSVARMERKEVEFNFELMDFHQLLSDVCNRFRLKIEAQNGKLTCRLNAQNAMVVADREHLFNLVANLLDNAIKYNKNEPVIEVGTTGSQAGITLTVADNGIGIPKNIQHKIFDTFYRKPTGNIHNVKGFGLGLSYAKAVTEAHKGTIRVESSPDSGSTFFVFFPYHIEK